LRAKTYPCRRGMQNLPSLIFLLFLVTEGKEKQWA